MPESRYHSNCLINNSCDSNTKESRGIVFEDFENEVQGLIKLIQYEPQKNKENNNFKGFVSNKNNLYEVNKLFNQIKKVSKLYEEYIKLEKY